MDSFLGCAVARIDSTNYQDSLDVLRRFIPTPLRTRFRIGETTVLVETNDFSLLPVLPLESDSGEVVPSDIDWKLIRDPEASGLLQEPLVLVSEHLTIVAMGVACLLAMDQERQALLCFIGAEIDTRTFRDVLVPILCQMSIEAGELISRNSVERWNEDVWDA
jgi:hypothetical protein